MGFLNSLSLPTVLAIAALMPIPAVNAHMSMFHPSMYGADKSDPETVYPLANKGFGQWWFHGNLDNPSQVSMPINPGQPLTVEIACSKSLTTLGGNPGNTDSCPNDQGSYHAGGQGWGGWGSNQASQLMGCALAIAYKSDANAVRPEDFIVMSVQENCVRQRNTQFDIPSNLPACPEGGCTCAWFWQGQASAEEMYMTGFKCNVNGGAVGANIPTPGRPKLSGNSDGPTQPFYWANDMKNVDFNIGWDTRPKYNGKMGWSNGAQNKAFSGAGGSPGSPATPTKSQSQGQGAQPTQSQGQGGQGQGQGGQWQGQGGQGQGQGGQANPDFPNYAAGPQTGAGSGNSNGNGTGAPHKPCKTVRRRRRSRVRRAAH